MHTAQPHSILIKENLPELHAELEVAVGVGERGQGDVRVAAELGSRYELVCKIRDEKVIQGFMITRSVGFSDA